MITPSFSTSSRRPTNTRKLWKTSGFVDLRPLPPVPLVIASGRRHLDPNRLEMKIERLRVERPVFDIYPDRL
jgi:hypothetical protein